METEQIDPPQGNVKGVLAVLGLCLALGTTVTFLLGHGVGMPSNTPDCSEEIVFTYAPESPGAPPSLYVKSFFTIFEIPRDDVVQFDQEVEQRLDAGSSGRIQYNEVVCQNDVSTLRLGEQGEQALKFQVRPGGGSPEVRTQQDETGAWNIRIVAPPGAAPAPPP